MVEAREEVICMYEIEAPEEVICIHECGEAQSYGHCGSGCSRIQPVPVDAYGAVSIQLFSRCSGDKSSLCRGQQGMAERLALWSFEQHRQINNFRWKLDTIARFRI